ncbi:hypothetical protein BX600DRAFT_153472 [Xylariales sp. PMI_506]|nr:hypothetical protein BX600DRAFT_153472 [Xylariales sp. PMI_506]
MGGEEDDTDRKDRLPKWDWTLALPDMEHVRFLKSVDWSKTHIGPIADWSSALRQATYQVIADSRPATLYWGPEHVPIYNAAFVPLAGATHPKLMGSTFKQGFPELWQSISPLFEIAKQTGIAADVIEAPMTVERNGYPEETFFTGNFTPIRDSDGQICGFYNALFEVTKQKVTDRRTAMLNIIATPLTLTTETVYHHIIQSLKTNENDITMAVMYQFESEDETQPVLRLGGHVGVPEGHLLLVDGQNWNSSEGLVPLCRLSRSRGRPISVPVDEMFKDIDWRGPGGPSHTVAIIPLSSGLQILGFLVIGTNPRLLDEGNNQFLYDLGRVVSGIMTSAVSVAKSRLRQERLERDLANSDIKIQHLVQHASVGMVHLLLDGTMIWANTQYFSIVGQRPTEGQNDYGFFDVVLEEDLPIAEKAWQQVVNGDEHVSAEIRLKHLYTPPVGEPVPATLLLLAFPYREDETVRSVMACTTDVSHLKWAENWQARLAKDAQEAKRQQEVFIDMVSHEMRNPLSAILHCVESIVATSDDCRAQGQLPQHCEHALVENLASARIIESCAEHQRYIVDSILTLGRMESAMLSITPATVRVSDLCESTVAMFKKEIRANNISTVVTAHISCAELQIDEVMADAARITQIIINLLTNAIKFVKQQPVRHIHIKYGACVSSPRSAFPDDIHWAPKGSYAEQVTQREEWGKGENIYLTFSVKDNGIGIDPEQRNNIFKQFKQANIKTHVFYGGSGLGLFVSKQLVEKQGGEIGVRSIVGHGSMFVFYILVRRVLNVHAAATDQPIPIRLLSPSPRTDSPIRSLGGENPRKEERPIHVLLVEDNIVNQEVLRRQLIRAECVVYTANHGVDALEQLQSMNCYFDRTNDGSPVDVILMDTQMPVMGGLECTREIRRLEAEGKICRHVPIIAVTANARQEQKEETITAGSDAFMSKPFKIPDLLALVKDQIKQHDRP